MEGGREGGKEGVSVYSQGVLLLLYSARFSRCKIFEDLQFSRILALARNKINYY